MKKFLFFLIFNFNNLFCSDFKVLYANLSDKNKALFVSYINLKLNYEKASAKKDLLYQYLGAYNGPKYPDEAIEIEKTTDENLKNIIQYFNNCSVMGVNPYRNDNYCKDCIKNICEFYKQIFDQEEVTKIYNSIINELNDYENKCKKDREDFFENCRKIREDLDRESLLDRKIESTWELV